MLFLVRAVYFLLISMAKKSVKKTKKIGLAETGTGGSRVTDATKRKLASLSGNHCANPNCDKRLVDPNTYVDVGEAAHIVGGKKGAARFDPAMAHQQLNGISNLLYLCANCHTMIDDDKEGKHYSVELLTKWKIQRERKDQQLLSEGFSLLDFPELEKVTDWLLERTPSFHNHDPISDFRLIAIKNKIIKHDLSKESQHIISEACSRLDNVEQFIKERTLENSIPPLLPDRLKAGVLIQYYGYLKSGQMGDELFTSMVEYMRRGFIKYAEQSASLAILVYFFEKCDIFSD